VTGPRHLALGAFLPGTGAQGSSWRLPEIDAAAASTFPFYKRIAQKLEAGRFDTLFMNDSVGIPELDRSILERNTQAMRWDLLTLLPALAVVTERIGLTATASTSYNEPYTLARRLAALDEISGGRAGWNMVTSLGGGENFNLDDHMLHAERYARAEEFIEVITGLWDSWEDGAAVRDKASGVWLDAGKMHLLNHKGAHFSVRGPLNAARPVQGRPVVAQAGSSDAGRALAARTGEMIFTAAQTMDEARGFTRRHRDARRRPRPQPQLVPRPAWRLGDGGGDHGGGRGQVRPAPRSGEPRPTAESGVVLHQYWRRPLGPSAGRAGAAAGRDPGDEQP